MSTLTSHKKIANPRTAATAPTAGRTRLLSPHALLVAAGAALPAVPALDPVPLGLAVAVVVPPVVPVPATIPVAAAVAEARVSVPVLCAAAEAVDDGETSDADVGIAALVLGELPEQISFHADEA